MVSERTCSATLRASYTSSSEQQRPLARREMLEGGHEREPDRVTRDGSLGRVTVRYHQGVRDRLQPCRFRPGVQVRGDGLPGGAEVHGAGPALNAAQHVQADVGGDAVEPGTEGSTSLEGADRAPGADERLLDRVLRLERRREHTVAVPAQRDAVALEPVLEFLTADHWCIH